MLWFEDIYGTTIFPAQNYVEGNRWMVGGFQYEIGQAFNGTLLYQYSTARTTPRRTGTIFR